MELSTLTKDSSLTTQSWAEPKIEEGDGELSAGDSMLQSGPSHLGAVPETVM